MYKILENTNHKNINNLTYNQKKILSDEIRTFLIENISKTGGHLSSNLGVVELTIALHSICDLDNDIIIFDVGHQTYVHKILTGRREMFSTLRMKNGLSGFTSTSESKYDVWETGHSSTSISAAIAYAIANPEKNVFVLIGDSSIVNGVSLEALNHLGELEINNVFIVLNDNDMSISNPVGGFSKTLNKINEDTIDLLTHFNVSYVGPYDGHDIKIIENVIKEQIYSSDKKSTIFHFKTKKGKGYCQAEQDRNGFWHGVGKFNVAKINDDNVITKSNKIWSDIISEQVLKLMDGDDRIFVTTPAMSLGSKLMNIEKKYPNRFFDVGISEEHAVAFNGALGETGKIKPYLSIYSSFLQRGYDFLLTDIARKNNHVVIGVDRAGFVGPDGPTHHGLWDVAFLSTLPNTTIYAPRNAQKSFEMLKYAFSKSNGIFAIRYEKIEMNQCTLENLEVPASIDWEILRPISKVNVLSFGRILSNIEEHIDEEIGLIDACVLNYINNDIINMLDGTKLIIFEEIIENNSLYEKIVKYCFENKLDIDILKFNVFDPFLNQATQEEQLEESKLSIKHIKEVIKKSIW